MSKCCKKNFWEKSSKACSTNGNTRQYQPMGPGSGQTEVGPGPYSNTPYVPSGSDPWGQTNLASPSPNTPGNSYQNPSEIPSNGPPYMTTPGVAQSPPGSSGPPYMTTPGIQSPPYGYTSPGVIQAPYGQPDPGFITKTAQATTQPGTPARPTERQAQANHDLLSLMQSPIRGWRR